MNKKNEIRTAVAAAILPLFKKTFPYRPAIVDPEDDLPAAFVYIEAGDPEEVGNHYDYAATMTIEIMISGFENLDNEIDQIEVDMNALLDADETIGGVLKTMVRGGFAYDHNPETASMTLALNYLIYYED